MVVFWPSPQNSDTEILQNLGAENARSQTKQPTNVCAELLQRSVTERVTLLSRIIKRGETWVDYYDQLTKRQSMGWNNQTSSRKEKLKVQTFAGKVMPKVFRDGKGFFLVEFLETGDKIK